MLCSLLECHSGGRQIIELVRHSDGTPATVDRDDRVDRVGSRCGGGIIDPSAHARSGDGHAAKALALQVTRHCRNILAEERDLPGRVFRVGNFEVPG